MNWPETQTCVENKGTSEAGVRLGRSMQRLLERYLQWITLWLLASSRMSFFYKSESGCKFGDECSFPHWKVEEQPKKKPKKGGDTSAAAILKSVRQLVCVLQDTEPLESPPILREGTKSLGTFSTSTIHKSYAASCQHPRKLRSIADWNTSQTFTIIAVPTLWKLRIGLRRRLKDKSDAPAETRGDWPRIFVSFIETDNTTFFSPTNDWCLPAPSVIIPEEREFVVDSSASMHMVSRKDLNSAELETVRISESPTTVVKVKGEVLTQDEGTVYVRELDLFVTVMLLQDTPAVLSLGTLCDDHWYTYHWTSGQKPQPHQKWRTDRMQHGELRTIRCPWSIDKLIKLIFTYILDIFIAGSRNSYTSSRINKKWEYEWWSTRKLVAWTSTNRKPK